VPARRRTIEPIRVVLGEEKQERERTRKRQLAQVAGDGDCLEYEDAGRLLEPDPRDSYTRCNSRRREASSAGSIDMASRRAGHRWPSQNEPATPEARAGGVLERWRACAPFAAPEASSVRAHSTAGLPPASLDSGSYQTVQTYAGRTYRSTWRLKVTPGISNWLITGISEWDCCPGRRLDPLRGTIGEGGTVEVTRDCTDQGNPEPCKQVFPGLLQ
jgi:hypothetical protein